MTTKQAIEEVLRGKRNGMRVPAIIEAGVPLATTLKGKTPGHVFYSVLGVEEGRRAGRPNRARGVQAEPEAGSVVTAAKLCTCGRPMRVEPSRLVAGGKGARVVLWYCEACDHAEHEVRRA